MISSVDIGWIAGLLEGEGSFDYHARTPRVSCGQKQREPLERLQKLLGGKIHLLKTGMSTWAVYGAKAAGLSMTILPLLSPRRGGQVLKMLATWKLAPHRGDHYRARTHCPAGHFYTPENTSLWKGKRRCKTCHREREHLRYRRARPVVSITETA